MAWLWVGLGGLLGANARYLIGGLVSDRWGTVFPWGTFAVNITGSFILGFFLAFAQDRPWVHPNWRLLIATGFLGAYTTFSTFTYESMRLVQDGEFLLAFANLGGSLLAGCTAAIAGIMLGTWL